MYKPDEDWEHVTALANSIFYLRILGEDCK